MLSGQERHQRLREAESRTGPVEAALSPEAESVAEPSE